MKVNKLITDTRPIDQPAESYLNAYNVILNKARGALTNEFGFKPLNILSKKLIYALPIDNDELVLWLVDPGTTGPEGSEIARLNKKGEYTTIVKDDALNFNSKNDLKAVFIRNFKGNIVVIYEDYENASRIINIDNIYPELQVNKSFFNPEDVELLNIDPHNINGYITVNAVRSNGGQVKTGTYYFTSSYDIPDGDKTSWGTLEGPVSIIEDHIEEDFIFIDGAEPDTPTTKSIELHISNIDTRYEYMSIAVIKKIGGLVTTEEFAKFKISGTEKTIIYTGGETVTELLLEEVLTPSNIYKSAKTLSLIGNTLTRGNLKANPFKEYNYQKYAKDIVISWVTEDIALDSFEGSYKDPMTILTKRGFFPDEVYAYYARLLFIDGSKSDAFHVPGPDAEERSTIIFGAGSRSVLDKIKDIVADETVVSYTTPFLDEEAVTDKSHFADDLKIDDNVKFFHTRETALLRDSNNMGVWYNETETYPDDVDTWGALAGQPVRHHKFPSMEMISNRNTVITEATDEGHLRLNDLFVIAVNHSKTESFAGQFANSDSGKVFAIPLDVVSEGTIPLQEQIPSAGTYYHDTSADTGVAHPEMGWYIYLNLDSTTDFQKFFIDQFVGNSTVRITYDILWKYEADLTARNFGSAAQIFLMFLNPGFNPQDGDAGYTSSSHGYFPDDIIKIESFVTGLTENNNQTIRTQGVLELPMSDLSMLGLAGAYIHVDNDVVNTQSEVDINFTFFSADIKISPLDAPLLPSNKSKVLGIRAENIVIPEEIAPSVIGYEILYAKRDSKNIRVLGQSLAFGSAQHPLFQNELGSHAGNNLHHINKEQSAVSVLDTLRDDRLRFHSFDMLKDKPSLTASYVKAQQYLEASIANNKQIAITDAVYNPDPESDEGVKRLTEDTPVQSHYLVDYSTSRIMEGISKIREPRRLRAISNLRYLPSEAVIKDKFTTINNSYSEECVLADVMHATPLSNTLEPGELDTAFGWLPANQEFSYRTPDDALDITSKYFLVNLCIHRQDVYRSMFEQELVSTDRILFTEKQAGTFVTPKIFGGDTFINLYGIRLTSAIYYDVDGASAPKYFSSNPFEAVKSIFYFPCYSVNNIGLRHSKDELKDSYYPKVGQEYSKYAEWVKRKADFDNSNSLLYNSDYTSVNDLEVTQPYNTEEDFFSRFAYRIIKSKTYLPEDKEFSLRVFLTNDFYEMPKDKGEITNLEGYGSALMIHTKYALYKTATQDRLSTDATEVVLGTGELFSVDPTEIRPSDKGFAGLQDYGAYSMSDAGYCFIDQEQSKIFLVGSGIDEITKYGKREFFRKHLKLKLKAQLEAAGITLNTYSNPYDTLGVGYNIAYDSEYERYLISKVDYELIDVNSIDLAITVDTVTKTLKVIEGEFKMDQDGEMRDLTSAEIDELFIDRSLTFSYDPASKSWICRHNYIPEIMVSTRNQVYSFKDRKPYLHNDRNSFGKYYDGIIYPSFADVVFNPSKNVTKQFPSIQWVSEVINTDKVSEHLSTITHIAVFNATHNTGLIELSNMINMRNVEGTWNFNAIRDCIINRELPSMDENGDFIESNIDPEMPYYNKRRMIDKYVIVRYLYDNLEQKELYLYDVSATYIQSRR